MINVQRIKFVFIIICLLQIFYIFHSRSNFNFDTFKNPFKQSSGIIYASQTGTSNTGIIHCDNYMRTAAYYVGPNARIAPETTTAHGTVRIDSYARAGYYGLGLGTKHMVMTK